MIEPEFLLSLRKTIHVEQVLTLVQVEQLVPNWWANLQDLADQVGVTRDTLSKTLCSLEKKGLIKKYTAKSKGGTWIWWVKRHATDAPNPSDEPCWKLRMVSCKHYEKVFITQKEKWADSHKIPYNSLRSFLLGREEVLHKKWKLISTPLDLPLEEKIC